MSDDVNDRRARRGADPRRATADGGHAGGPQRAPDGGEAAAEIHAYGTAVRLE